VGSLDWAQWLIVGLVLTFVVFLFRKVVVVVIVVHVFFIYLSLLRKIYKEETWPM
jgi:hypothetical protein